MSGFCVCYEPVSVKILQEIGVEQLDERLLAFLVPQIFLCSTERLQDLIKENWINSDRPIMSCNLTSKKCEQGSKLKLKQKVTEI